MKTYFSIFFVLAFWGLLRGTIAQTIQTPFANSAIHWDVDIFITNATKSVLQSAVIETKKNINITSSQLDLSNSTITVNNIVIGSNDIIMSNTIITCKEIEIQANNITMNNVTINCEKITFTSNVMAIKISKTVKFDSKDVIFSSTGARDLLITNNGTGELLVTGKIQRNDTKIIFKELENFKVDFENE